MRKRRSVKKGTYVAAVAVGLAAVWLYKRRAPLAAPPPEPTRALPPPPSGAAVVAGATVAGLRAGQALDAALRGAYADGWDEQGATNEIGVEPTSTSPTVDTLRALGRAARARYNAGRRAGYAAEAASPRGRFAPDTVDVRWSHNDLDLIPSSYLDGWRDGQSVAYTLAQEP